MKHLKVFLLLLLVAPSASAQTDSTQVKNAALQRSFLKEDRLTLRLYANMPFNKYYHNESVTNQGDYTGVRKNDYLGRRFQISLSYRFGISSKPA